MYGFVKSFLSHVTFNILRLREHIAYEVAILLKLLFLLLFIASQYRGGSLFKFSIIFVLNTIFYGPI